MDEYEIARLQAVETACRELAAPGVRLTKNGLRTALETTPITTDPITAAVEETV